MELHQLQCFIAVLEEGGFKRATARLGVTQPALSYQIKRLEEELGVQVLHRGPGGITPTQAGRVLLEHAHLVISAVREAHQAVREMSAGVTGEIRIGAIKCVGTYFLPRVLWEIRSKHPLVRPELLYFGHSDEVLQAFHANKLDVGMVVEPPPDPRVEYRSVFEEQISLVSGPGHSFYGRPSVDLSELENVNVVSLSPKTSAGALIRRYLVQLGISVVPAVQVDTVESVKRMVEAGMGVAFLPDMSTSDDVGSDGTPGRLSRSKIEPTLSLPLVLVTWRDVHHSLALDAFVDEVCRIGRQWDGLRASQPAETALQ